MFKMADKISDYEKEVRACFKTGAIQRLYYGGQHGTDTTDPNKMYVCISEDENWWSNKCVLHDWYFDYEQFRKLQLDLDCADYGVYVICRKTKP